MTELPTYKECHECGTYNLRDDHFCGYCAEDFCQNLVNCTQCSAEDFEVY